ncbi:MAG: HD domain-containing phosphohydrolase, partial [Thermodesulfobacteriota bacterium]
KKEVIDALRALHDLSKAINSTLDIDEVVEIIMDKTSRVLDRDRVLILLLDRDRNVLSVYGSRGFEAGELPLKHFHDVGSFDHCIVHKGSVITMEELLSADEYRGYAAAMPLLSEMVFAPLEKKGEAYGLLGVTGREREFTEIELEMFCALGSQAAVAIENAGLYRKLKDEFLHTAEALAEAVNSRDPYTGGHTRRVMEYALMVADAIGLEDPEREDLKLAAILHDIGKIGIDDAILRKGGVLTTAEERLMRQHPEIGARILGYVEEMSGVIPGVRHHHERFDGGGYPDGLEGEDVPLAARIIAVVDAFDALTTDRPYKKAIDRAAAAEELGKSGGTQFDPALVKVFRESISGGPEGRRPGKSGKEGALWKS